MSLLGRGHLGDDLAALVDGELDHGARDRALAHLTHCRACRDEADAHRRLKARLVGLRGEDDGPAPDLLARLASLPGDPGPRLGEPVRLAPPPAQPLDTGSRRSGTYAAAGVLVAAGVVALLVVPAQPGPSAPAVDPTSPVLVTRYAELTGGVPFTEPGAAVVAPVGAAGPGR